MIITHLDAEQTKTERRKLLGNDVFVLMNDALKLMKSEGNTSLSHVESFLSARNFANLLISLPNVLEGIDDELDDLVDEAEGENDAMIVSMVASSIILAVGIRNPNIDAQGIGERIVGRWIDHPLFYPLLDAAAQKEEKMLKDGRIELLKCEIAELESSDKQESAQDLVNFSINMADGMDADIIKACIIIFERWSMEHQHCFDAEIKELYNKLTLKTNMQLSFDSMYDVHGNTTVKIGDN